MIENKFYEHYWKNNADKTIPSRCKLHHTDLQSTKLTQKKLRLFKEISYGVVQKRRRESVISKLPYSYKA